MIVYTETDSGSYSRQIAQACEELVNRLHAADKSPRHIRVRLHLLPRRKPRRFDLPMPAPRDQAQAAEFDFVNRMLQLGVERDFLINLAAPGWQAFPETHEYLERPVARLERELGKARIEKLREKSAIEQLEGDRAQIRPPASLDDILGRPKA